MSPMLLRSRERLRLGSGSSYHSAIESPADSPSLYDDLALTPPADDDSQKTRAWSTNDLVDNLSALGLAFGPDELSLSPPKERFVLEDIIPDDTASASRPPLESKPPFERWMKTLNKRATLRRLSVSQSHTLGIAALDPELYSLPGLDGARSRHRKSNSGSSIGFVTAMKSASVSLASMSIAPRSRKMTRSSKYTKTDRSSRASNIGPRTSEDSTYTARGIVNDTAVTNRAIRRRHVLEEIIKTEEGYCGDIKFLMTVSASCHERSAWLTRRRFTSISSPKFRRLPKVFELLSSEISMRLQSYTMRYWATSIAWFRIPSTRRMTI